MDFKFCTVLYNKNIQSKKNCPAFFYVFCIVKPTAPENGEVLKMSHNEMQGSWAKSLLILLCIDGAADTYTTLEVRHWVTLFDLYLAYFYAYKWQLSLTQ